MVWAPNSRYAEAYLDTDTTSPIWGIDAYFNTTTMAVTEFEGNNVIAYNYQAVNGVTNGDWMKFDSESSSASLMKEIIRLTIRW